MSDPMSDSTDRMEQSDAETYSHQTVDERGAPAGRYEKKKINNKIKEVWEIFSNVQICDKSWLMVIS